MTQISDVQTAHQYIAQADQALARLDRMRCVNALRHVLAKPVALGQQWKRVINMAHQVGDIDAAVEASRHLCREEPDALEHWLLLANLLEMYGDADAAFKAINPQIKRHPKHVNLHFVAGHMAALAGKKSRAVKLFRAGLRLDPAEAKIHYNLSLITNYASDTTDLAKLTAAFEASKNSTDTAARIALCYAWAKACTDRGDMEQAARIYAEAAGLQHRAAPFDLAAAQSEVSGLKALYTPEFVSKFRDQGFSDTRPVFILGAPRSGTTLIEQILAAHSDVKGGGEHGLMSFAAAPLDPQTGGALQRYLATAGAGQDRWATLGQRYLHFVEARLGKAARFVDKNLGNYRYLGAAALAMPDAKFIWCRRDPMDVAWSAWRTLFSNAMAWSYEPAALAGFLKLYDDAMCHWQRVFPERVLEVSYHDLITDSDAQIARMFEFLDLDDQQATRQFHRSGRSVATASFDQVRKPINSSSVGVWKQSMPHNSALRDAVKATGLAFDDL
jgi:tetratricopeptide (TPR) repeat protein